MNNSYLIAASITLLLYYLISTFFTRGLHVFPGPVLAKFTNLWRLLKTWQGHYEQVIQDLHRRHGDVVCIGPNVLSVADPNAIESIYGAKADLRKVPRRLPDDE